MPNEEGLGIQIEVARLDTGNITKQIQDQLNKIHNLSIKLDKVDTSNITKSIQSAINEAYKGAGGKIPLPVIPAPSGSGGSAKPPKIEDFYPKGYAEKLARIEAGFRTMGKSASDASNDFKKAQVTYKAFESAVNSGDIAKATSLQSSLRKQVRGASSDLSIARYEAQGYDKALDAIGRAKLSNYLQKWLDTNTAATKEARTEVQQYFKDLKNGIINTESQNKSIRSRVETITNEQRAIGKLGGSLADTFSKGAKKFTEWGIASGAVMKGFHTVKEMYQTVKDIDTAMTELEKVSDATGAQITKSLQDATKTAKTYAASIGDVVNATADWSRLGYNLPDSNELAKIATIYKNVGDGIDIDTANQSLVSTLQGFQLEAKDALSIVDKFNEVANKFPIDTAGIGEALQRSAASFYAANTDLSKSIALISGTNSVVQDPVSVGNMWKTVSMRIRGATTELEDAGLETEGMVETTAQLRDLAQGLTGFDIMKDENTFKDIYDIVIGIGEKWGNLKDIEQASLLEALAGKRQGNALSAALNNIDMIKKAYGTAEDSAGSAMREQETYLKSIEAKTEQFGATFESLSNNLLNSDLIKFFVDLGTVSLSALDNTINLVEKIPLLNNFADGGITSLFGLTGAILGAKGAGLVSYNFDKEGFSWKNFSSPWLDGFKIKAFEVTDDVRGIFTDLKDYLDNDLSLDDFITDAEEPIVKAGGNLKEFLTHASEQNITPTAEAYKDWATNVKGLGKQFDVAKVKAIALNTVANMAVSIGVSLLLQGASYAWQEWINNIERVKEKAEEAIGTYQAATETLKSNKETIKSISDDYERLSKGVDAFGNNVSLNTAEQERYHEITNKIAEMFPEMVKGYDAEGNAIIKHKGNVDALTEAYKQQEQAAKDALLAQAGDVFNNFKNQTGTSFRSQYFAGVASLFGAKEAFSQADIRQLRTILQNPDRLDVTIPTEDGFSNSRIIKSLKNAGIEKTFKENYDEYIRRAVKENPAVVQSIISNLETEAESAVQPAKDVVTLYLEKNPEYSGLTQDQKDVVSSLISSLDVSFFSHFGSASGASAAIVDRYIKPLQDAELSSKIYDALNLENALQSNELSISEYYQQINDLYEQVGKFPQDQQKNVKYILNHLFGDIDVDVKPLVQNVKNKLQKEFGDNVGELSLDDLEIASTLEVSEGTKLSWEELNALIDEYKEKNPEAINISGNLTEKIDQIQSAYKTMHDAIKEYNKEGAISVDTYQALLELEPEHLRYLFDENGQLQMNEEALQNVTIARIQELAAKQKQKLLDLADTWTDEAAAQEYLSGKIGNTTDSYDALIQAQLNALRIKWTDAGWDSETIDNAIGHLTSQFKGVDSLANKTIDGIKSGYGILGESAKDKIEKLKNEIEKCALAIEKFDRDISNLDLALEFLDDDDYAGHADLLAQKLQLITNKGAALKSEFEQLANTTPQNADEAGTIASRLSTIGDTLRSNLKDWVEYTKELEHNKVQALVDSITDVDTDKITEIGDVFDAEIKRIENVLNRLKGETLFGDVSFFSAIMPEKPKKSDTGSQQSNYSEQIAELQEYEDRVYTIQKQALDMQYAENQAAWAKERQELTNSLSGQEQELRKAKDTSLNTQDKHNQESEKKQKEFAQNTKNVITDLNTWIKNNPLTPPSLDGSWNNRALEIEDWAKRVQNALGGFSSEPWSDSITGTSPKLSQQKVLNTAAAFNGTPYVWGGSNLTDKGLDCSGYIYQVLKKLGYTGDRTTADGFRKVGTKIDKSKMQPGDLLFFDYGHDGEADHIGIYAGNGKMWHSSGNSSNTSNNPGKGVHLADITSYYENALMQVNRNPYVKTYATGTQDYGIAGENHKKEWAINKKTGEWSKVDSPTLFNKNEYDIVGEKVSEKIDKPIKAYATGTVDPMDIAKYIRDNYPEITNAAIAGILGNIYAESNFNQFAKTIEAYGSGSNRQVARWGLFQLDDERIPGWSNIVTSGNWQKQIDTVLAEGRYQNSGMGNSQKHNMWQYITDTSLSASDIASLWDKLYERSDGSARNKRISYANDIASTLDFSDVTTRVSDTMATETVNKYQQKVDELTQDYSPSVSAITDSIDYFKNDEFRQAKINEYKERFEANPQSLNDYIQAIEYANKATAQSTIEFYDAETKVIMETADKYKTAHKELQEAYTQVGQGLQDAINNGESQEKIDAYYDELKQIVEATQDLESKMESVDSQWQSMIDSIVEFHKTVTDRHILEFNPEQWYADKDLEEAELKYSRQNRYTTQIEALNGVNSALETQIKLYDRLMGTVHEEANKIRDEYSDLYSVFTSEEIEDWFNPDGSLSEDYNKVLELYSNNPEILTLIKELGQALSYNKTQYRQYQDEQKKFIDQVYDNQSTLHQHQLDMALQVAENIQGVHNKIISSLQKEEDLLNRQLNNASKFSQKQDISENLLDNYRKQQQAQYNSKAEFESEFKALMARPEYADIISKFDTSKWLDSNGQLTAYYYSDLDNKSLMTSTDEWETAKGLGELMSKWSVAISDSEKSILDLSDNIKSVTDNMYQQQIDAVNTAIDTVVQMIEKRKERELKALEQTHNKRIEQLQEESEFIQEAYSRATSLLDDIKSEEDYEKQLSDEQKVADNLQAQIAEYSLDDSDGAKQKVLELQKQLNEQLEKINDLKRNHEYEQTKKALNDDLEAYNKYWDEIQKAEDDQYQHNQELIEARYTEEAKYHEAIRVLQSGTFDDFTSKGVYAYETIYSKGNQVALDLTAAYDSFATETGTKFQNLGLEFKNITALLEHNIELIDIFNSKAQDWNVDTNTSYTDHTGNDYYNNITKPNNNSLGRDEGVTNNYGVENSTSSNKIHSDNGENLTSSQQTIINKMIANSQKWGQIMSTGLSYDELPESTKSGLDKLHDDNDSLAKELAKSLGLKYGSTDGLWYDGNDGTWYRKSTSGRPVPLYHAGRISKESQKAFDVINNTLKPNEEVAIIKTDENVITMEQMQEWAKNISLHTPSLSSIPSSVSQGLRALDKSMHSATNNLESNIDNSKHLNIEKISIGANNAVTKSDVKSGVFGAMKKVEKSE